MRYDILKNKKFDDKKLKPKISEQFSIVIIWPLQMLGLKGSHNTPDCHRVNPAAGLLKYVRPFSKH